MSRYIVLKEVQMVLARFEFHPGSAEQFAWSAGQTVVEMTFDNVFDLIKTCQELEDAIKDCTAIVDGNLVNLKMVSA
jgi:uncharacterized protein YqgV (UPF0045/DUF77 family)